MLFNTFEFIFLFLPLIFFIYFYLNQRKLIVASKFFLVTSSLFFYSWFNIKYLPLILGSMIFNYLVGKKLSQEDRFKIISSKKMLIVGIFANISLLGYFKYTDFLISTINIVSGYNFGLLHIALPLAISFFTFQQIAYLVDSYHSETLEYDFLNYALFVTFFPQLIAGPIVHHSEMMPQFSSLRCKTKNFTHITMGLFVFSLGLFKKIVVADTFAIWANKGFDLATTLTFYEAWSTSLSYTMQLYFDFSGYTDMATGVALLFNIVLPVNFNSPYKALNIGDFWQRWHVTLSRFLRDYVYIPLGGNRKGIAKSYVNVMLTFVLAGLWHGAGWTFVLWGCLHGIALVSHRLWLRLGFTLHRYLAWFITFNFINIAWVFFRAKKLDDVFRVLHGMISVDTIVKPKLFVNITQQSGFLDSYFGSVSLGLNSFVTLHTLLMIIFGFCLISANNSNHLLCRFSKGRTISLSCYMLSVFALGLSFIVMSFQTGSEFLYFNF